MTSRVRVILVEPEHEGNIGSIARAMKNFNLKELWLVNPRVKLGLEASVYAVNAKDILESARIASSLTKALVDVDLIVGTTAKVGWSSRNVLRTPMDPKLFAKEFASMNARVALLFGRESKGLSNRELNLCDIILTIPTSLEYRPLNVAAAATIVFYELFSALLGRRSLRKVEARSRELRTLEIYFDEICEALRLPTKKEELTIRAFRNILHRSYISRREGSLLIGALRRTSRKLRSEG